jgi:hypothetical protein
MDTFELLWSDIKDTCDDYVRDVETTAVPAFAFLVKHSGDGGIADTAS